MVAIVAQKDAAKTKAILRGKIIGRIQNGKRQNAFVILSEVGMIELGAPIASPTSRRAN